MGALMRHNKGKQLVAEAKKKSPAALIRGSLFPTR
jgi:hypothetical protein